MVIISANSERSTSTGLPRRPSYVGMTTLARVRSYSSMMRSIVSGLTNG